MTTDLKIVNSQPTASNTILTEINESNCFCFATIEISKKTHVRGGEIVSSEMGSASEAKKLKSSSLEAENGKAAKTEPELRPAEGADEFCCGFNSSEVDWPPF